MNRGKSKTISFNSAIQTITNDVNALIANVHKLFITKIIITILVSSKENN